MNFQFSQTYCSFPQTLISSPLINFLQTLERPVNSTMVLEDPWPVNGEGRSKIRQTSLFVKLSQFFSSNVSTLVSV